MARRSGIEEKSERSLALPSRFVPIGGKLVLTGSTYICVVRPKVRFPRLVCSGCGLRSKFCNDIACSRSDRVDGESVWFVPVEED